MPRFSIVIPSYGNAEYLPACLDSIRSQDCSDWEAVVVIDASPDNSLEIAREYAESDERFIVVNKKINEGRHLARKTGVEAVSGDFILFLDSDDEFEAGVLGGIDCALRKEQSADMLHFGIRVIGEGVSDELCSSFESFVNQPVEVLEGSDIVPAIFGGKGAYRQDWRITQRAFSAQLVKTAFSKMPAQQLDCAEDAFEMFVISSLSKKQVTRNDVIGLHYHLGRGLNGASAWGRSKFASVAEAFWTCSCQISRYADSRPTANLAASASGARNKLMQLLFNDWRSRVVDDEKLASIEDAASILGSTIVSSEVMRCVRDASYETLTTGTGPDAGVLQDWRDAAYRIADRGGMVGVDFPSYLSAADDHIRSVRKMERVSGFEDEPIRIFVSAHKPVEVFDSQVFQPVQVGASRTEERFMWALRDDEADNISDLNPMYCELTTQYWAWKNDAAAWQGIFHYRRYLSFDARSQARAAGEHFGRPYRVLERPTAQSLRRAGYDPQGLARFLEAFDVIAPVPENMGMTAARQYETAPHHYAADLTIVRELLRRGDPRDWRAAEEYLNGTNLYFGNLFLMRRPLFERYSAWLFDLLAKYDEQKDVSGYSPQSQRVDGYLAERLFGVYLTRLRAEGTAVGFVPRLHFAGMESRGAYLKQRAETLLLPPGSVRRNAARRLLRKI